MKELLVEMNANVVGNALNGTRLRIMEVEAILMHLLSLALLQALSHAVGHLQQSQHLVILPWANNPMASHKDVDACFSWFRSNVAY